MSDLKLLKDGQDLAVRGNLTEVPIAALYRANNVRTAATLQIDGMIASIKRHGFKPNHPLVVSAKRDGRYLVLCGNRRAEAVETIFANEPDLAAATFPSGCIACVVHSDLTEEQEALLRVDHSVDEDRVPLDEFGEFLAIRQLVRAGYDTQAGIADKMGWFKTNKKTGEREPNRSKVQPRVNLAQLPQFVQDEMARYCAEPSASNLRWSHVATLYKAYNEEFSAYPNGDGPLFRAEWAKATAGPDATDGKVPVKPITPADLEKRAKLVGSRNLRDALMTVAGIGAVSLTDIDGAIVRAETAESVLADIADFLGEKKFAKLVADAGSHASAKNTEPAAAAV